MKNPRWNNKPRFMAARYAGRCAETRIPFNAGDEILWFPREKKAYCQLSKTYRDYADALQDDRLTLIHRGY